MSSELRDQLLVELAMPTDTPLAELIDAGHALVRRAKRLEALLERVTPELLTEAMGLRSEEIR